MLTSLPQWLSYIETLHPKVMELGLQRVQHVATRLNILNFNCPVITVAGTNGKGSCVAFIEAIAKAAGYRAGAYTSPHLLRFKERIRIAGQEIDDTALVEAFTQVEKARADTLLTYFEFTTLAALWLFHRANLDVLVLEVGLGGRLDAVNIIEPDVTIITSIALDHMEWLGDTREAIGYEKAGIFRAGKPAICGDINPPNSVIATAKKLAATLYCRDVDFGITTQSPEYSIWIDDVDPIPPVALNLPPASAATAVMALHCLKAGLNIPATAIREGLEAATLSGRFQRVHYQGKQVILDVAHNPAASEYLAQKLSLEPVGLTHAVVSILSDKDISGTLQPLLQQVNNWFVAGLDLPRGTSGEILANHLQNLGVTAYHIHIATSTEKAFHAALQACGPLDRIIVFGSFHTVAPILAVLND